MEDGTETGAPLEAVAAAAGVSRATVSRVINGLDRVSPKTRRSVQREVDRLGYTPNRVARSLATRRTDSVALVIPEPTTTLFGHPFFPRLVAGISEVLSGADKQLVLMAPQSREDEERLRRYLLAVQSDGVLIVSLHGADPLPGDLAKRGVPVVVGGRPPIEAGSSLARSGPSRNPFPCRWYHRLWALPGRDRARSAWNAPG